MPQEKLMQNVIKTLLCEFHKLPSTLEDLRARKVVKLNAAVLSIIFKREYIEKI